MDKLERATEFFFEILKSTPDPHSGAIKLEGILTDESLDLDNEIVKAAEFPRSIEYLRAMGKCNYDHGREIIGNVTDARFADATELNTKYKAELGDRKVVGKGVDVSLEINPIIDPLIAPEDLKRAHHHIRAGTKLGLSMQTPYATRRTIKGVQVAVPEVIPLVAVTPLPKNLTSRARIAKSICDAFT